MRSTQPHPIGNDFKASVVQQNFEELFELAHDHRVLGSLPSATSGESANIFIVDDGTNVYLAVKTSRGWFKTSALTAI